MCTACSAKPFGLFAGVEFGNLGDKTDIELNCISQYYKRARVDMEWLSKIVIICENNPTYWNHLRFRFNSDCYEAGNRLLAPGLKLQVQFNTEDMKKVEKMAKKYGILYSVLPDCNRKDGLSEVIFHSEAVPRVNMMAQNALKRNLHKNRFLK